MDKINVFWHRRDFRYRDNAGLFYALDDELPVLPIFILDTNILDELDDKDDPRVTFIMDCIRDLDQTYRNVGSGLMVYHSTPEEAFNALMEDFELGAVFTNRDYEPYAKERDKQVEEMLAEKEIDFFTFKDQVIFEEGEILNNSDEPYKVFTPYSRSWLKKLKKEHTGGYKSELKLQKLYEMKVPKIPSLESIGFKKSAIKIPSMDLSESTLKQYEELRDFPAEQGTTRIGVHLRFGTISIREAVKQGKALSKAWLNELIWREFYMMILAHYPNVVDESFKPKYDQISWNNDEENFKKWCEGKTGYPIVDAGMRQLNEIGYMHNRVRMITASFLTKHLLIDWRWGERYFARKLLDYELSSNNGGWQWAAGTGTDAQPYFRVFNPYSQQEKYDKEENYIRKWVPEFDSDDYPDPIVPHKEARERAISTYKKAVS